MFFLLVISHLTLIGSQAMGNIWLCMWSDNMCMPSKWNNSIYGSGLDNRTGLLHSPNMVGKELAIYGAIGAIQGKFSFMSTTVEAKGFQFEQECLGIHRTNSANTKESGYCLRRAGYIKCINLPCHKIDQITAIYTWKKTVLATMSIV